MDFFDLQVNGYGGIDFNQDDLTAEQLHTACEYLQRDGSTGILATLISEEVPRTCLRLSNLVRLRERDDLAKRMIPGIHIEGPFISDAPGFRGAHPADAIHPANEDEMKRMLDAAGGLARIVTLAPERDQRFAVTKMLADQGIVVSGGHSDASLDDLSGAIDAGLSMWTHLGNGCPMQVHRHDNIIQRVLSRDDLRWICFIADGAHVAFCALKNYIRARGIEKSIVVTDAVAPAGLGPGKYKVSRWDIVIGDDLCGRAPDGSHLIGSAVSMPRQVQNLKQHLGLTDEQCRLLTCVNPRSALAAGTPSLTLVERS